ncbi:hypothetical protein WNZ15_25755 [Roseibium sp. AS2]|uniref:hypothetical protein n=1 Tax=Roseibium sp. AS2 TaxID=3135781 RepID=UPI00316E18F0
MPAKLELTASRGGIRLGLQTGFLTGTTPDEMQDEIPGTRNTGPGAGNHRGQNG